MGHPSGVVSAPRHILTALAALTARVVVRAHRIALGSQRYNGHRARAVWVGVSVVALHLTGRLPQLSRSLTAWLNYSQEVANDDP